MEFFVVIGGACIVGLIVGWIMSGPSFNARSKRGGAQPESPNEEHHTDEDLSFKTLFNQFFGLRD